MMRRIAAVVCLLMIVGAPLAAAQDLTEPAQRHVQEKLEAAQKDPQGFVADHASPEGAGRETNWTVAYACFLLDEQHDQGGPEAPDLEQCEDYEEAIGVEEEPEEPVAEAEELADEPVAEAEALAEDAQDAVADLLEDPTHPLGPIDRILGAIGDFAGALVTWIEDLVGGLVSQVEDTAGAIGAAWGIAGHGIVDAVTHTSDSIADGLDAVGDGIGDGVDATVKGVKDVAHSVQSFVEGLVGSKESKKTERADEGVDTAAPVDVPCATCLVDEVTKKVGI